jgi:hypothetical protein
LKKYRSVEYTKQRAEEMMRSSWLEINILIPASNGKERLRTFVEFLLGRKI